MIELKVGDFVVVDQPKPEIVHVYYIKAVDYTYDLAEAVDVVYGVHVYAPRRADEYRLAIPEEIAAAVARRITR